MDILIEEMDGSLWVAALDRQGRLQGVEVDPIIESVRWGSIYWAKVERIDAAMDAAFVNLDGDHTGLLNNADVLVKQEDGSYKRGGDVAIGKVLRPGQMVAVQAKAGYIPKDPEEEAWREDKNPRVSMNIVLPGRYLIYAPLENENRVSQRIRDKKLRKQLVEMLDTIKERLNDEQGFILRAAAAGMQTDMLVREAKILRETWRQLQNYFAGDETALIMDGPDAVQRILSDHAGTRINQIAVSVMDHYQHAEEWCEIYAPDLVTKIEPIELEGAHTDLALFDARDIIGAIESLFQPYAILPSGGTLIIQQTAAFMAIDVNKAGDTRGALAVNMEAAQEIARQIRLRNLGGAVIVDFMKMKKQVERDQVKKALEAAVYTDPCTVQIHGFTNLGMMEITRQRRTPPLSDRVETIVE